MRLHYALFDQSVFVDGDYWTWASPEVRPLLSRFHGDVAVKHLPPRPNDLQGDDLWGGLARLAGWTVAYRYLNGGWDKQGRPGRAVLLTAWAPAGEAQGLDLLPVFTNETFRHVAENAKAIPVPPPFALQEDWAAGAAPPAPFREGDTPFAGLAEAARAFATVPTGRTASLKIIRTATEQHITLSVPREQEATAPGGRASPRAENLTLPQAPPKPSPQIPKERIPEYHRQNLQPQAKPLLPERMYQFLILILALVCLGFGWRYHAEKKQVKVLNAQLADLKKKHQTKVSSQNDIISQLLRDLKKLKEELRNRPEGETESSTNSAPLTLGGEELSPGRSVQGIQATPPPPKASRWNPKNWFNRS